VHKLSGFTFPDRLGPFPRHVLKIYDAAGRNVSAGYDIIGNISVTICVYPAPLTGTGAPRSSKSKGSILDAEYGKCLHTITTRYRAECVSQGPSALACPGGKLHGRDARFRYAKRGVQLGSVLHLFHHGDNFLKVRATYRRHEEEYALAKIGLLLEAFRCPKKPR